MILDFNTQFSLWMLISRLTHTHPDIPRDKKWLAYFIPMQFNYTLLNFSIVYSTIFHDIKDFSQVCANMSFGVMYVVVNLMQFLMVWYRKNLKELIVEMDEDYDLAANLTPEEREPVELYMKRGVWFSKFWTFLASWTMLIFMFQPLVLMLYYYIIGEFQVMEAFAITYPPVMEKYRTHPDLFIVVVNILFYILDIFLATTYMAVVPLPPIFMLHACGQLNMMKVRINRLFPDEGLAIQDRKEKLREIVIQSQKVYSFIARVQTIFLVLYEIILKGSSIIMPIFAVKILQDFSNGNLEVYMVSLLSGAICLSGFPCYYGDVMIEQAEDLREVLYACGWEAHWDRHARIMILVLLTRMQKTLALRSVFRVISLDTLADVYRTAYTIFNFLITAWS